MSREFVIGIDIGTQSTRVALVNTSGKVLASHNTSHEMIVPRHGWAEQDPDGWWAEILAGIRFVIECASVRPEEILALGADSQMHATIPLSRTGELLSHSVQLWCDKRGSQLVETFKNRQNDRAASLQAGNPPVAAWIGFKIKWLKTYQPELYESTWKFLTGSGFFNYRATGELSIDWTEASGTFLMDAGTCGWSTELADSLEIDLDKLPPIFRSAEIVGNVTRETSRLTGLVEGTPVVAGGGDMLITLLSAGLAETGCAVDISGTASDLVFYVNKPILDPPLMNLHHPLPGWCPFGITESGGGSLKWLKDELARDEAQQAYLTGASVYDILNNKAAREEPGCKGLLYFPYLMGERVLGTPNARGVFFGLNPNTNLGTMVRAVMEGVTFELRRTLEIVEAAGNRIDKIFTTGGGARSDLWSQIKADIYQKPVYTLAAEEGGVLGSALLAMAASGIYPDVQTAVIRCVQTAKAFYPNPGNFARYDYLFSIFKQVHDRLQSPFDDLTRMP